MADTAGDRLTGRSRVLRWNTGEELMAEGAPRAVRFGPFELNRDSAELRKRKTKVRLQDKPLRLLEALVERPGVLITRDELRQRLWSTDTFVDFDNGLNNAVN